MDLDTEGENKLGRLQQEDACGIKVFFLFSCTAARDVWSGRVLARVIVFIQCQTNKVKVIVYVDTALYPLYHKEAYKMSAFGSYPEENIYLIWKPPWPWVFIDETHQLSGYVQKLR